MLETAVAENEISQGDGIARPDSVTESIKWKQRNRYYYECLNRIIALNVPVGSRVLELGSGDGELLAALQPQYGVGIDSNQSLVRFASQTHPHLVFHHMDAHNLYLDEHFDYIVLSNLLGEVRDIQEVMYQVRKVCHDRSKILIVQYNYLWEPVLRLASRIGLRRPVLLQNWLGLGDLYNLLDISGYRIIRTQLRVLCPKYVPLLSHLLNRYLAIVPGVNRLCLVECVVASPRPTPRDPSSVGVSVIIPTKDERDNISAAVQRTPNMGEHTELIFVDGRSADGTVAEIERVIQENPDRDIKLMHQDGYGKADAVRKGFEAASGEILMILDSDLTMPPEELPKYFEALVTGHGEFINGSRLVYQLENQSMRFLNLLANKIFAMTFCWLLEQRLKDTLCGTKVMYKSDYLRIAANRGHFGDFDPFGDFDLLFGAAKLNLKIVEIPIRYQPRTYGEIKIGRFRHGWLLLKMCVIAFRKLKL